MDKRNDIYDLGNVVMLHPWIGKHRSQVLHRDANQSLRAPERRLHRHHEATLWTRFTVFALGLVLLANPSVVLYGSTRLAWSDAISGVLLMLLSLLTLSPDRLWAPWAQCLVGLWLLMAPLVFHAPTALAYFQDTVFGALVIAFSVLIPRAPGMALLTLPGPEIPTGWSFNPSAWTRRVLVISISMVGYLVARYLAAFELGHLDKLWDPFFEANGRQILITRTFPISLAGFLAVGFLLQTLIGFMGSASRWRTVPWLVLLFALITVPLTAGGWILLAAQPISLGHWSTLCLVLSALSIWIVPFSIHEVLASLQFLAQVQREGHPFWETFWLGGTLPSIVMDQRSAKLTEPVRKIVPALFFGMSLSWHTAVLCLAGIWLMISPTILRLNAPVSSAVYLGAAAVLGVSIFSISEILRGLRRIHILLGLWVMTAPWVFAGATPFAKFSLFIAGIILIAFSYPRGRITDRYGSWNDDIG